MRYKFLSLVLLATILAAVVVIIVSAAMIFFPARGGHFQAANDVKLSFAESLSGEFLTQALADHNSPCNQMLSLSVQAPGDLTVTAPACTWFTTSLIPPLGTGRAPACDRETGPAVLLTAQLLAAITADPVKARLVDALPASRKMNVEVPRRIYRPGEKTTYRPGDVVALVSSKWEHGEGYRTDGELDKGDLSSTLTWYWMSDDKAADPLPAPPHSPWKLIDDEAPKPTWDPAANYDPGTLVAYVGNPPASSPSGRLRLFASVASSHGIDPTADGGTHWTEVSLQSTLLLDRWGNPMILVPSGGLADVATRRSENYDYNRHYRVGDQVAYTEHYRDELLWTYIYTCIEDPTKPGVPPHDAHYWFRGVRSPDGRPFWASAGPDGSFLYGDDNIYSFEQP